MPKTFDIAAKPEVRGFRPPMLYVYEDTTWEYRMFSRDLTHEHLPTEEEMNSLGAEGWELAGVVSQPDKVHFYLKRVRKEKKRGRPAATSWQPVR